MTDTRNEISGRNENVNVNVDHESVKVADGGVRPVVGVKSRLVSVIFSIVPVIVIVAVIVIVSGGLSAQQLAPGIAILDGTIDAESIADAPAITIDAEGEIGIDALEITEITAIEITAIDAIDADRTILRELRGIALGSLQGRLATALEIATDSSILEATAGITATIIERDPLAPAIDQATTIA